MDFEMQNPINFNTGFQSTQNIIFCAKKALILFFFFFKNSKN